LREPIKILTYKEGVEGTNEAVVWICTDPSTVEVILYLTFREVLCFFFSKASHRMMRRFGSAVALSKKAQQFEPGKESKRKKPERKPDHIRLPPVGLAVDDSPLGEALG
jgi:hypothetical protein